MGSPSELPKRTPTSANRPYGAFWRHWRCRLCGRRWGLACTRIRCCERFRWDPDAQEWGGGGVGQACAAASDRPEGRAPTGWAGRGPALLKTAGGHARYARPTECIAKGLTAGERLQPWGLRGNWAGASSCRTGFAIHSTGVGRGFLRLRSGQACATTPDRPEGRARTLWAGRGTCGTAADRPEDRAPTRWAGRGTCPTGFAGLRSG
jgi:hypothetical protein